MRTRLMIDDVVGLKPGEKIIHEWSGINKINPIAFIRKLGSSRLYVDIFFTNWWDKGGIIFCNL